LTFKPLQVFFFSLIPLALVFTGVIIASFRGSDSEAEVFPTPAPAVTRVAPTPSAPGAVVLQIRASNLMFDKRTLQAGPGSPVTLQYDNADAGVLHNFALYNNNTASQTIFRGDLVTGPVVTNYTFTSPAPGNYFFRCDSHPDTMTGTFTSR
jgi:plastocyanin